MKVAVIGAGGIGSYLVKNLDELMNKHQLPDTSITVFDDDGVEEENILYQDFTISDILSNKAEALCKRYFAVARPNRVNTPNTLKEFDLIISCVDNTSTRKLIFVHGFSKHGPDFIDLRSEGKAIAAFTKVGNTLKGLLSTLPKEEVSNGSCQLASDKKNKTIQQGNKLVAIIGSQLILDRVRGENTHMNLTMRI